MYSGTVTLVKGTDCYEVEFDSGEVSRDKKSVQLRLMRSYYVHEHEHVSKNK